MKIKYYNQQIETLPINEIKSLQSERFVNQVNYAYNNVPYYRDKMDKIGINPVDIRGIQDLHKLPYLSKKDLVQAYPYGLLAKPLTECVRIHATSGTTGKRIVAFYSQADINFWNECCARAIVAAGGTKDDVIQVSYGYGLFTGGLGIHGGASEVGALTLPMSSGNKEQQIQFMCDFSSTILCCTPSYALCLAESIEEMGLKTQIKLKAGIFGAEAWTEEMRQDIENKLGIKAYDIYGLTEIIGPGVAFECLEQRGMHINEDGFIPEIIDPKTEEVLPENRVGELVLTCITKEAYPLLRYRTGDLCMLFREQCSCGRTHIRMQRITGRSDDMLTIRGVNVFPSQIETVLLNSGFAANYQIQVNRIQNNDILDVNVEITTEMLKDNLFDKEKKIKEITTALKSSLGVSANVYLLEPKTIKRSEGKAKRVIDKRKLFVK